jgi:glycosyltransferase involved in cell wall biosynthesis
LVFPFQVAQQDFSGFDVLHAQGDDQFIPRRRKLPVVRTMHGSAWAEAIHNGWQLGSAKRFVVHSLFYICELAANLRADQTIAVSHDTRRYYSKIHHVIPNGVAISRFADLGEERSREPSILFVGDLDSRKRGRLLLKVFLERVRPVLPNAMLWLICPERVDCDGVLSLGSVDDDRLAALYRAAWVFCLPSSYEGFGRPYVEAMAAGAAVVATPNPGAREVLQNGKYGAIVDDEQLGDTLCTLLRSAEIRQSYASQALERAHSFSWENVAIEYERVYESVLANR